MQEQQRLELPEGSDDYEATGQNTTPRLESCLSLIWAFEVIGGDVHEAQNLYENQRMNFKMSKSTR